MSGVLLLILRTGLAVTLYTFLGWAILTLWRDLKYQEEVIAAQQIPSMRMVVQIKGESFTQQYKGSEIIIGRDPASDCSVNSETVSAAHTRLSFHHNQWWVEDLQSTNGTYLNGEKVSVPIVITHGDILRCGEAQLTIQITD